MDIEKLEPFYFLFIYLFFFLEMLDLFLCAK